ncbi:MAG TPA: metallophosphatase domain-containing protein, partial [Chroococcales cyanobacterium]
PHADLLLIAGDMTMRGTKNEMQWFADWLVRQPQKHKVWIAGNHELGIERDPQIAADIAEANGSIYLNDSGVDLDGIKIWGSPVTPWFHDWAFNRSRGEEIAEHWRKIPEGLDILLTHGPPYGILDLTMRDGNVGCEALLETVSQRLENPPRYHIFGHIHFAYGKQQLLRADGKTISMLNASICDELYREHNPPHLFEL